MWLPLAEDEATQQPICMDVHCESVVCVETVGGGGKRGEGGEEGEGGGREGGGRGEGDCVFVYKIV